MFSETRFDVMEVYTATSANRDDDNADSLSEYLR
jgi:hypothetical protein